MLRFWCILVLLLSALPALAIAPDDIRLYASFDVVGHVMFADGKRPELMRGTRAVQFGKGAALVPGIRGKALAFGAKDSAVRYATHGNLPLQAGSISLWTKALDPGYYRDQRGPVSIFVPEGGQGRMLAYCISGAEFHGYQWFGDTFLSYHATVDPEWKHLVITWRPGEITVYTNGEFSQRYTRTFSNNPIPIPVPETVGEWMALGGGEAEANHTAIDELYLINRPLEAAEVRLLYLRATHDFPASVASTGVHVPSAEDDRRSSPAICTLDGFLDAALGTPSDPYSSVKVHADLDRLYVKYIGLVPAEVRANPVLYPEGAFKMDTGNKPPVVKDGIVHIDNSIGDDDYVHFDLGLHSLTVNPRGATALGLRPHVNGRQVHHHLTKYNAVITSHVDQEKWELLVEIPWKELRYQQAPTEIPFKVTRHWERLGRGNTCWSLGKGTLRLREQLPVAVKSVSKADYLAETITAFIPATVQVAAPGVERTIPLEGNGTTTVEHAYQAATSAPASITVTDADGATLYARSCLLHHQPATANELIPYPGLGLLDVKVAPVGQEAEGLSARVSIKGHEAASAMVDRFSGHHALATLNIAELPAGQYTVVVELLRAGQVVSADELAYEKKRLPAWHGNATLGVPKNPPPPWTKMNRVGQKVFAWGREFHWKNSLLPVQIVNQGDNMLAAPMALVLRHGETEQRLTAGRVTFPEKTSKRVTFESTGFFADGTPVRVRGWVDYDSFLYFEVQLADGELADAVVVEMPLHPRRATLHTSSEYQRDGWLLDETARTSSGWFGNEHGGVQFLRRHQVQYAPREGARVLAVDVLQHGVSTLEHARGMGLGMSITPTRPLPAGYQRWWSNSPGLRQTEGNGLHLTWGNWPGWAWSRGASYPVPRADYPPFAQTDLPKSGMYRNWLVCYYLCGVSYMSPQSPDYADFRYEWSADADPLPADADANFYSVKEACAWAHQDFYVWQLNQFLTSHTVLGLNFDCDAADTACRNPRHGAHTANWLVARQFNERVYTLLKQHQRRRTTILFRHTSHAGPLMSYQGFADAFWQGEASANTMRQQGLTDWYTYMPLARFRAEQMPHNWGVMRDCIPYFSPAAPEEMRARIYSPEWEAQATHVAGLCVLHDTSLSVAWLWGVPWHRIQHAREQFGFTEGQREIRFVGYWDSADWLQMDGEIPEQVVCSLYLRTDRRGRITGALFVPFNNTDEEVTVTLRPDLAKLRMTSMKHATLRDLYQCQEWEQNTVDHNGAVTSTYHIKGSFDQFPMTDGACTFTLKPRSFRLLVLE